MDRGAWQATVHGVAESDATKHVQRHSSNTTIFLLGTVIKLYFYLSFFSSRNADIEDRLWTQPGKGRVGSTEIAALKRIHSLV